MKIGAIISEYNPFHNGHKYQIETIKAKYNIDYLIIIMSGDFTQRGEPAIIGKEKRCSFALKAGADLVLLLPLPYATGGAELFAYGAVSILTRLNCVDYLFFGCETDDVNLLSEIAEKSVKYESEIIELTKSGKTYAASRSIILEDYDNIINSPNNILAIEYIKAIKKLNSKITPVGIKRTDNNFNSSHIENDRFASAKTIRTLLESGETDKIKSHVPEYVYESLLADLKVTTNNFSEELYYSLITEKENLDSYLDITNDLKNRINLYTDDYSDFLSFINLIKSKNYTYSRIQRGLLHILLKVKNTNEYYIKSASNISHIRILGFRKNSAPLLSTIGRQSSIILTSKVPDVYNSASKITKELFDYDLLASYIYSRKSGNKKFEYQRPIEILNL